MKKYFSSFKKYRAMLAALALLMLLGSEVAQAAPPGPPRRQPPPRSAEIAIRNLDTAVTPNPLSSGVEMTYNFQISVTRDSPLEAQETHLELPFNGNQQFISFSSDHSNWTLRTPVTNTVYVDMGTVAKGESGTMTIKATFATNYDKPIFRQTVYLEWLNNRGGGSASEIRRQGQNITMAVNLSSVSSGQPVPTPTPQPRTDVPTSGPFAMVPDPGTPNTDSQWYFPATGHTLHGEFLNYWLSRTTAIATQAGLTTLGYPVSEEFNDNGRTVQYFQRAVLEFWPENPPDYRVLLRSLGRSLGTVEPPITQDTPSASADSLFFNETGHWLDGRFVQTWEDLGGLRQFGFPIGEAVIEGNTLIQWTERARFELDLSRPDQLVMLGLVGTESAQAQGLLP